MKVVLLTGARGFIGRHCIEPLLRRGYAVHATSSSAPSGSEGGVTYHRCDLLDVEQSRKLVETIRPTHLLHLAWYAVPGRFWTAAENLRWMEASQALCAFFRASGGRRAVFAGSCAEYDWSHGVCSEAKTPTGPRSLYGVCKHSLHSFLEVYAEREGFELAWGRVFFLYGPHEHPSRLVSSVILAALDSREARCTAGTQVRDFQHVGDAAGALVALLDSSAVGPVNIASGSALSVRELVMKIAGQTKAEALIKLGALPMAADEPPLLVADTARLRGEIGWNDHYDIDTGLSQTIEWWRAHQRTS